LISPLISVAFFIFLFSILLLDSIFERIYSNSNEIAGKTKLISCVNCYRCSILPIFYAFSHKFPQYMSQRLIFFETLDQCIFISKIEMLYNTFDL